MRIVPQTLIAAMGGFFLFVGISLGEDMNEKQNQKSFYEFSANDIQGKKFSFDTFKGKVVLVVNTASQCGLTPQYEGLQKLYETYASRGFVVLGIPCNDFGRQEPGSPAEIVDFVSTKYRVTFPMLEKTRVKGDEKSELYLWLLSQSPEKTKEEIGWNFTKFLIDREGKVIRRFEPTVEPLSREVQKAVESAL